MAYYYAYDYDEFNNEFNEWLIDELIKQDLQKLREEIEKKENK